MKILIDNSNLYAGGGIQVAISFLNDLKELNLEHEYHIIQSPNIAKQVDISNFPSNFTFYDLPFLEHKNIFKRIRYTKKIENCLKPECIFTVFGPSYHKSNFPKVVGFALPYIIYPDSPFFEQISIKEKIKYRLMSIVKTFCFDRNSDALIFESDDARRIFEKKLTRDIKTYKVNNTLNTVFNGYKVNVNKKDKDVFNILCLSANYPHKNLNIIPDVVEEILKIKPNLNFRFNISANKSDFKFDDKYNTYINFIGRVDLEDLPQLYDSMNLLFMPTLLEVFSTTYLEAMYMQLPIVASDMSFAKDICGKAALFCESTNPKDYAKKIVCIFDTPTLSKELIDYGLENLKRFGNSMDRTKAYLNIITETTNASNQK